MALLSIGGNEPYTPAAPQPAAPSPAPTPTSSSPSPTKTPSSGGTASYTPTPPGLDSTVYNLTQAIRQQESGGNYNAKGADGEIGAYQFTPATWSAVAPKYGITSPLDQATPQEQNAAAYNYVLDLKNQGYNPVQIASIWNSGNPDPQHAGQGTSAGGAAYNTPAYSTQVYNYYNQFKQQELDGAGVAPNTQPSYGATFQSNPNDNLLVSGIKALGNIPSSIYGVGAGLLNIVAHPIQTATNLGSAAVGAVENVTGSNPGNPDQYQQTANNLGSALAQRYNVPALLRGDVAGFTDSLKNTFVNDPAGAALDIATLIAGGEGVAAKTADLADLATGGKAAQAASNLAEAGTTGLNVMPQYGTYGTMARQSIDAMNKAALSTLGKIASPITALPSKVINSVVGGGASEDVIAAAQRTGVDLPAAALTKNPVVNSLEAIAATGGGEAAYTARVDKTLSQMSGLAQKIIDSTGGETDPVTVGNSIAKGAEDLAAVHEKAIGEIYQGLEKTVGDVAAKTDATTRALNNIVDDMTRLGETTNLGYFKNKLDVINGAKASDISVAEDGAPEIAKGTQYNPPTYSTLKDLRTLLGKKIKNFTDPVAASNKQDLIKLYASLSQDMRTTLLAQKNGAELASTWDKANLAFGDHMDEITSQYAKTIRKLSENGQESKIVSALIKPSTAIEDIPRIMEVAGQEGAANIRATFTKQILDNATDPVTGNFTAGKIEKEMAKYQKNGADRVAAILKPEQVQQLQDLGKLADGMKSVMQLQKGASSQFLVKMALQLKTLGEPAAAAFGMYKLFTGDVVGAAQVLGGVVGFEGLSRLLASDLGNSILKWGALHGSEFTKVAKAQGLTDNSNVGTINPYGNESGSVAGGGNSDTVRPDTVGISSSDGASGDSNTVNPKEVTPLTTNNVPIPDGGISPAIPKKLKKK